MSDALKTELKSCPFCGSRGIGTDNYWHHDYCTNCGARGPAAGNSPKAAWNTRATDDKAQALVERAYHMGLDDAAKYHEHLAERWSALCNDDMMVEHESEAKRIRAIPTPTDLVERVVKEQS